MPGKTLATADKLRRLTKRLKKVSNSGLRRLARRGGVKRLSGQVYQEMNEVLKKFLEITVYKAVQFTDSRRRKTLSAMDVVFALRSGGRNIYGFAI